MKLRVATLLVFLAAMLLWLAPTRVASTTSGAARAIEPQRPARQTPRRSPTARAARADYTNFSHATAEHRKSCDSCHKFPTQNWRQARAKDAAFPDITEYPQHSSCLDCHRRQFFARERPVPKICAVCHVNATPRHTVRWPFPSLGPQFDDSPKGRAASSDFAVNFPHAKHEGLFSQLRPDATNGFRFVRASFARARQDDPAKANAACATCHLTQQPQGDAEDEFLTKPPKGLPEDAFWPKKGMYKTSPRDHATCFTCHSQESGVAPAPTDCAACHKLLPVDERVQLARAHGDYDPKLAAGVGITDRPTLLKWARRDASRFRHEWPPHDLACVTCHNVATMNTADEKARRVPIMSCGGGDGGCHVTATVAEGGTLNVAIEKKKADPNFQCAKCHVLLGKEPVPASHLTAVTAGAAKPK